LSTSEASFPPQNNGRRSWETIIVNASGGGDYTHIQWAIDNASDGDTVYVEPSTYFESVIIDKSISLIGSDRDITIIDGTGFDNGIKITANWSNVSGIKIINCNDDAIELEKVSNCNIKNNTCTPNVGAVGLSYCNNIIISNNICSSNKGGIGLYYSTNNFVENNTCNSNEFGGIGLYWSPRNTIYNNIVNFNKWAIHLAESDNNVIENNICNNSIDGSGIYLTYSSNTIIANNTCNFNSDRGIFNYFGNGNNLTKNKASMNSKCGVYLTGNNNIITSNICDSNRIHGIALYNSTNQNTITNNTFYSNTLHGINIGIWPSNNLIHHNNYISNNNNGTQASDDGTNNQWDDGIEGNFWSNWTIPDTNDNGIVDLPYNISGSANAQDHFPLVNPISELLIIADAGDDVIIDKHQIVTLDGTNSWGYPTINNYTWTFNYNSTPVFLYGSTPSFTFEIPGTYLITLTVKNESGNSDTDQMIVYVRDIEPPLDIQPPIADAGADKTIHQGETFIFNGSGSSDNVGIINYTWNFSYNNNSVILYGISPRFTFDIPGIYNVTMNISDARGNWATDVIKITVMDATEPIARAGEDVTVDQHEIVHFDGSTSYDNVGIINYSWNFVYEGSEIYLYKVMTDFKFDEAGTFLVTLTVSDGDGYQDTDTLLVTVRDITPPIANAGPDITVNQHKTVFFDPSGSSDNVGITDYAWSFTYDENPIVLNDENSSFIFHDAGSYVIILNITDADGNWATDTVNITVLDITPPFADAGPDLTINQSQLMDFGIHQNSSDNVGIVKWIWTFKYDNYNRTIIYPKYLLPSLPFFIFYVPGTYEVTLNVSDEAGNWATDMLNVTVRDTSPPIANGGNYIQINQNGTVDFNGNGSKDNIGIVNYTWTFYHEGELITLYGISPTFMFTKPGNFTITLTVSDSDGNQDMDVFDIIVNPIADPSDLDNNEDSDVNNAWIWIIVAFFIAAVLGVFVHVLRRTKDSKAEQSSEDDLGSVEKEEIEPNFDTWLR